MLAYLQQMTVYFKFGVLECRWIPIFTHVNHLLNWYVHYNWNLIPKYLILSLLIFIEKNNLLLLQLFWQKNFMTCIIFKLHQSTSEKGSIIGYKKMYQVTLHFNLRFLQISLFTYHYRYSNQNYRSNYIHVTFHFTIELAI